MSARDKNNQRLAARFMRLTAGKQMTLEEFQAAFKEFCKSVMKPKLKR